MEPASTIIQKLGGESVVAEITRTASTAPYRWQYSREKGGTGGVIPQRYHRTLLSFARDNDIPLSAEEFLPAIEAPDTNADAPADDEQERAS